MRGERMLHRGRQLADSLMHTTVIIRRKDGEPYRDPVTGKMVTPMATVYEGLARVRFPASQPRDVDQSGQRVIEQSPTVWVPVNAPRIRPDDMGEVTANPPDPVIVGVQFRVAGVHAQTHSTSRRLPVEVLTYAGN